MLEYNTVKNTLTKCVKIFTVVVGASALAVTAAQAQSPTLLRLNLTLGNQDAQYHLYEKFASDLEAASNGTLKVEVFPSETLGKTADIVDAISRGAPILQMSDPTQWADYVPDFAIFGAPYLFQNASDIEQAWKSDVGQELSTQLENKGLHVVTLGYFGTRHLLSDKEIVSRADTNGLKIRNAPTKMWNEVSRVLGGNPTNTAWSEAYSALEQGVADAVESPLSLLYSSKIYETRDRISLTGHLVASAGLVMSQSVYENLSDEAKSAIDQVGSEWASEYTAATQEIEKEFRIRLEQEGITFNEVDKSTFLDAAADVPANFPEWSPNLYERILEAVQ